MSRDFKSSLIPTGVLMDRPSVETRAHLKGSIICSDVQGEVGFQKFFGLMPVNEGIEIYSIVPRGKSYLLNHMGFIANFVGEFNLDLAILSIDFVGQIRVFQGV